MRIFKSWDEQEKASAIKIVGLIISAITIFILIACCSYLFSWKTDMNLLGDAAAMDTEIPVANAAGKLGFRTGFFFITELFGIGSFPLILILAAVSVRLLLKKWHYSLVKTGLIALFGAFISSFAFAYISRVLNLGPVFGAGLGGQCGDLVISWAENLFGIAVTGLFIVILIVAFLFFSSRRFNIWFAQLGTKEPEEAEEPTEPEAEPIAEPEPVIEPAVKPEPIVIPEPVVAETAPEPATATEPEEEKENFEIIQDDSLEAEIVELKPIDNRLDPPDGLPKYKRFPLSLLQSHISGRKEVSNEELTRNNNKIRAALANYKIQVTNVKAIVGPTVTLYKVYPAPGVKISDIKRLQEDIALSLNAKGVRVVQLQDSVGIEVANDFSSIVPLQALLNDPAFNQSKAELPVAIGYTITQDVKVFDLTAAPHLLIAGATQQGKSVGLNVIVSSLLYSKHPSELKFVFIDPKMVEFSAYSSLLKHYLAVLPEAGSEEDEMNKAIIKQPKDAERILRSICTEMDNRYELMSRAGVNKVTLYNEKYKERKLRPDKGHRYLPYLVVVVDEYADLTMTTGASPETKAASRSITNSIIRLAQKGRAAGLHVILATQRPSVDVISGIIKSNFPMRIAFRVASRVDSMTILDAPGAEKLIGKGDMLFSAGIDIERIQCAYISGDETDKITEFIGTQQGYQKSYNTPYYLPEAKADGSSDESRGSVDMNKLDDRFEEAARMVVLNQKGSTSDLQRKLGVGYPKAGTIMDQLEAAGIVGPQVGSKARQVLVSDLDSLQSILDAYMK